MCLLPLSYFQPPSLIISARSWCSYCLGMGVAGLSVLTHTHTPPWLNSQWLGKNDCHHSRRKFDSPTTVLKAHALPIHVLVVVCSSTDKNRAVFLTQDLHCLFISSQVRIVSTNRYPSVLGSHRELRAVRFHPQISWEDPFTSSAVCSPYRPVWLCNFRHFNAEIGTVVLPTCLLFSWGYVIRLLGVVLATKGPRTTQKSFPLFSCNFWVISWVQWSVFGLCREKGWGWVLLDKPGGWNPHR